MNDAPDQAISHRPSMLHMARPYLAGVLHGDGWCTDKTIGLRAKDRDFVQAFRISLFVATGKRTNLLPDGTRYWCCRASNSTGRFSGLRSYEPTDNDEVGWWLRGLFDSDGNAQITPVKGRPCSFSRRVAIFSTTRAKLERAADYLEWLAVPTSIRTMKNSPSHFGSRTVYEIRILRREGFVRFAEMVGSCIARKSARLQRIVSTYQTASGAQDSWSWRAPSEIAA